MQPYLDLVLEEIYALVFVVEELSHFFYSFPKSASLYAYFKE